jgi:Bax protein
MPYLLLGMNGLILRSLFLVAKPYKKGGGLMIANNVKNLIKISGVILLGLGIISWAVSAGVPDFTEYEAGVERKKVFLNYFLPLIEEHNTAILKSRVKISEWSQDRDSIGWWGHYQLENLLETYQLDNFDIKSDEDWATLLRRVDIVPVSLALAQAANESGWGTSRFGREGFNYYGQWCYKQGCGLVPKKRGVGDDHEVAVFNSPEDSVESYLRNINSNKAYTSLREIRARLRATDKPITGIELARGLSKYSQRGSDYINELRSIIRHNNLLQHDINNY